MYPFAIPHLLSNTCCQRGGSRSIRVRILKPDQMLIQGFEVSIVQGSRDCCQKGHSMEPEESQTGHCFKDLYTAAKSYSCVLIRSIGTSASPWCAWNVADDWASNTCVHSRGKRIKLPSTVSDSKVRLVSFISKHCCIALSTCKPLPPRKDDSTLFLACFTRSIPSFVSSSCQWAKHSRSNFLLRWWYAWKCRVPASRQL